MPQIAAPILSLPEYTAKIPESARAWTTDPKTITIRSFTVGQDKDAKTASEASNTRFEFELLQRCTVAIDGKPVDQDAPDLVYGWSPQVRVLATRLLNRRCMPTEKEIEDFDASVEVRVP